MGLGKEGDMVWVRGLGNARESGVDRQDLELAIRVPSSRVEPDLHHGRGDVPGVPELRNAYSEFPADNDAGKESRE